MSARGVDPGLRDRVRQELLRDYKQDVLLAGNRTPPVRRLPSGSLALDYIMGGEGYPFGAMTRLWGPFSSGKSSAVFKAFYSAQHYGELRHRRLTYLASMARLVGEAREAKRLEEQAKREQDVKLTCLFVCTENAFDSALPLSYGVDLSADAFEIAFSRRIEQIGEIVQKALPAFHVVAVDSTTGTMSIDELATGKGESKGVEDEAPNTGQNRARKWGYNMDWWQDRMSPDNVLLFTSQVQVKSAGYNNMTIEQAPGGEKLNHEPGVILHFMKGKKLKRRPDGGLEAVSSDGADFGAFGKSESAGQEVIVRCDKNKFGRAERVSLHHFDRSRGQWDPVHEYEKLAKYLHVVRRTSSKSTWYTLPDGTKTQSLRQAIVADEGFRRQVEERVYRCAEDPLYEDQVLRDGPGELMLVESA